MTGGDPRPLDETVRGYLERAGLPSSTAVEPLAGDASTRRYVRLRAAGRPSRILMVQPMVHDPASAEFLDVGRLLTTLGVPVPQVIDAIGELGVIALEDLGDVTLEQHLQTIDNDATRARYLEAVDLLGRLQRATPSPTRSVAFTRAFDVEKLSWELGFFVERFVMAHRGVIPTPDARAGFEAETGRLVAALAAEPRVLCHRDYHSRNLMWHAGRLHVIDFQDARLGPSTYDLASLVRDSYVTLEDTLVEELLEHFRQQASPEAGRELGRRLDVMSIQRHLKALGTFGHQATLGRERYADAVPRTLGYLRASLTRQPDLVGLRRVLASWLPELA